VWRDAPGGGVYALGETVAYWTSGQYAGDGCFLPITDLVSAWGAWLPVWPSGANAHALTPANKETHKKLPVLNSAGLTPAVGTA